MTTAATALKQLPTGGCNYNFPDLDKNTTCGCQRFLLRKKVRKPATHPTEKPSKQAVEKSPACGSRSAEDNEENDDDEDVCRCGHYSCYHSGHPTPEPRPTVRLQDPVELQRNSYTSSIAGHGRKLSVSTVADDAAIVRADRSANAAALSAVSGTTTERDSSASGTPRTMIKPPWTTKAAAKGLDGGRDDNTKQMSGQLQTALEVERLQMSPMGLERPPSVSSNASMSDRTYIKEKLRKLIEYTNALSNNQISERERLEIMEVPQALEELAEKFELMDDHVNEKVDNCETRLKNELDDRLAPIETFLKAHQARGEKRKRRYQARGVSEAFENSSSIRHDQKRRRRLDERDNSEILNSQPHGITTTSFTTTSFTTTTSSFSSPAGARLPEHVTGLKVFSELEMLKSRLADVESVAPPTVARPWVVEVVLIPPALRGIWAEAGASIPNTQHTGSEAASGSYPALYKSQGSQQSGLVPFSFSPKCKVYKRLHSRGFIKRLHITGPSAREVSFTIETNFSDIIEWFSSFIVSRASSRSRSHRGSSKPSSISSSQHTARGGTRNLWQPLRKIYKQAALEFLPSSELSAPALWTVDFLKANCMMRGTTRKPLYIVPRSTCRSTSSSLTWDDIKQLARSYDPDSEPEPGEPEQEEETYWKFDPKLDAKPLDVHTSSFFSEPFISFGPFPAEGESLSATPVKFSVSSHLASPQRQEATPPDTVPQLQPRHSNKLNQAQTPVVQVETETEDDMAIRIKKSPKSVHSAPLLPQRSPPSPSQSYPQLATDAQNRRKKAVSKAPGTPPPHEISPTDEDSPPQFPRSGGTQRSARSFDAFETLGVGGWQDGNSIARVVEQQWDDAHVTDAGSMDWASLFGPPTDSDILAGLAEAEGLVEDHEDHEEQQEGGENADPPPPQALVLPTPLPVGNSIVDYDGDGGYHSD